VPRSSGIGEKILVDTRDGKYMSRVKSYKLTPRRRPTETTSARSGDADADADPVEHHVGDGPGASEGQQELQHFGQDAVHQEKTNAATPPAPVGAATVQAGAGAR